MKREKVVSSNLKTVGYDSEKKILEIEFKSGGVYQYNKVGEVIVEAFLKAESLGYYFHKYIKGTFECVKQDEPSAGLKIKDIIARDEDRNEIIHKDTLFKTLENWIKIYEKDDGASGVKKESRESINTFLRYLMS